MNGDRTRRLIELRLSNAVELAGWLLFIGAMLAEVSPDAALVAALAVIVTALFLQWRGRRSS